MCRARWLKRTGFAAAGLGAGWSLTWAGLLDIVDPKSHREPREYGTVALGDVHGNAAGDASADTGGLADS